MITVVYQKKKNKRVVSAHKSEYQHAVILDRQNKKRKREKQAQENSKRTPLKKMKLSFLKCVESFQNKIDQGPCYICVVYNRNFYKKSVTIFKNNENNFGKHFATNVLSYDNKKYICTTCKRKLRKIKYLAGQFLMNLKFLMFLRN